MSHVPPLPGNKCLYILWVLSHVCFVTKFEYNFCCFSSRAAELVGWSPRLVPCCRRQREAMRDGNISETVLGPSAERRRRTRHWLLSRIVRGVAVAWTGLDRFFKFFFLFSVSKLHGINLQRTTNNDLRRQCEEWFEEIMYSDWCRCNSLATRSLRISVAEAIAVLQKIVFLCFSCDQSSSFAFVFV